MAIRIVDVNEVPKRRRHGTPRMMQTKEWKRTLETITAGLKSTKAIVITLTPAELAQYGIPNIKAAARPLKAYFKKHELPYMVSYKYTAEGGTIVISQLIGSTNCHEAAE